MKPIMYKPIPGWYEIDVKFCPMCGRRLEVRQDDKIY